MPTKRACGRAGGASGGGVPGGRAPPGRLLRSPLYLLCLKAGRDRRLRRARRRTLSPPCDSARAIGSNRPEETLQAR
eukprot:9844095-Alexandrium_andersonii.AAC.1